MILERASPFQVFHSQYEGMKVVFNLTSKKPIYKTECLCFTVLRFKSILTGPSLSTQAPPQVRGSVGPRPGFPTPALWCSVSLPWSPLTLSTSSVLAALVQPDSPTDTVPVFVLSHHTQYLDNRHPRSLGCHSTKLVLFLIRVGRV